MVRDYRRMEVSFFCFFSHQHRRQNACAVPGTRGCSPAAAGWTSRPKPPAALETQTSGYAEGTLLLWAQSLATSYINASADAKKVPDERS